MVHHPHRPNTGGRPFWLPASTYYFLSAAVAMAVFFIVWAILNDANEESPWIAAGLVASVVLIAAAVVREIIMKSRRIKVLEAQRRMDRSLLFAPIPNPNANADKLTLERNGIFLNEIRRRSEAAKVLSSIPESHKEVFHLCEEYMERVDRELPLIGVGSPRLRPLTKGRDFAVRFHRYHMLRWAEEEVVRQASSQVAFSGESSRLESAGKALASIETALAYYPDERKLVESALALRELMALVRVDALIERAKNAKLEGREADKEDLIREAHDIIGRAEDLGDQQTSTFERLRNELRELEALPGSH